MPLTTSEAEIERILAKRDVEMRQQAAESASKPDPSAARILQTLTADHPHAVPATRNFTFGLGGGLVIVRNGDLADDRSDVVRHPPRSYFERPAA